MPLTLTAKQSAKGKLGSWHGLVLCCPVDRVVHAVEDRRVKKIPNINSIDTSDVEAVFARVGPALMMGVDTADRTEIMDCGPSIETTGGQLLLALRDTKPRKGHRRDDDTFWSAHGAVAAAQFFKSVRQVEFNCYSAAMAGRDLFAAVFQAILTHAQDDPVLSVETGEMRFAILLVHARSLIHEAVSVFPCLEHPYADRIAAVIDRFEFVIDRANLLGDFRLDADHRRLTPTRSCRVAWT
jgi:hypothetical protein